jgi:hypothetical protein
VIWAVVRLALVGAFVSLAMLLTSQPAPREQVRRIVTGITGQIATLAAYRKSLIHECATGQRRITEEDLHRTGALVHAS